MSKRTRAMAPRHVRHSLGSILLTFTTFIIVLLIFFPVLWISINAFKTEADAYASPPLFIFKPILLNIIHAFGGGEYLHYLFNSVSASVGSVLLANIFALPIAFYLAELKWKRGTDGLFTWVLSTRFMPVVGIILPLYVIFNTLHLLDTKIGLLLIYTSVSLPLIVVIMRSFFLELPYSIIEAAVIEGGGFLSVFTRIVMPLSVAGISTSSILAIIFNWNEYFLAVSLNGRNAGTLPIYLASFITSEGLYWANVSGIALLAILPILIMGWLAQRNIVQGLTLGAVKG
jgi:sorbitol/mannitol transport system permease protein